MNRWLLWLARAFGSGVTLYAVVLFYREWCWGHLGLHMRTFSGETQSEIDWQATSFLLFHTSIFFYPTLLLACGALILLLAWRK